MCRSMWIGISLIVVLGLVDVGFAQVQVEAVPGIPFGVGRFTVSDAGSTDPIVLETNGYILEEENGRAYYPTFTRSRAMGLIRDVLGVETATPTGPVTAYFLFRGDQPLRLTLHTPQPQTVTVQPVGRPRVHARLMRRWWRLYDAQASGQQRQSDYPPIVETYLSSMLAKRLGLRVPLRSSAARSRDVSQRTLQMLLNLEGQRLEAMRATMAGPVTDEPADLPLPPPTDWPASQFPEVPADVQIEPIAMHVPVDCFYIRFGKFSNYLWLKHLLEENGGDVGRMVTLRGHDALLNEKIENQLGLKESMMARLLGDQVISDVALIGRDTFLREGAATGILFEARNPAVLKNDLNQKRRGAMQATDKARENTLDVQGREVSFIHAPGNHMRSFLVNDGSYILVTNSLAIVEGFVEAGRGKRSLGKSREFRFARVNMPVDRMDTAFAYLSVEFLRGLLSPHYQVELRRRLKAVTDIELVHLARLAAAAEQSDARTLTQLSRHGFLPYLAARPDGSRLFADGPHLIDSARGARGFFTPIPDVAVDSITASEANELADLASLRERKWGQLTPLSIGILKTNGKQGREHVDIDAWMLPFDPSKFTPFVSLLGPPSNEMMAPVPGDVVSIQAVIQGGRVRPDLDSHLVFLGLQDMPPRGELARGRFIRTFQILTSAPAYFGTWPKVGWLDALPMGAPPVPDEFGYQRYPFGLWRWQSAGFSVLSLDRHLLEHVTPHLRVNPSERPAQLKVHVADLSTAKLGGWVNQISYRRAYDSSIANTRLLNALTQQLRVPRKDSLEVAEKLLDVALICALGGDYTLQKHPTGFEYWSSSHWDREPPDVSHQAPLLDWFRGLDASLSILEDRLVISASVEIQRDEKEMGLFRLLDSSQKRTEEPK